MGIELVVIGAVAYRVFIPEQRYTQDIDLVVALDLDEFGTLEQALMMAGWMQDRNEEQRWFGKHGTRVDLLPAGKTLREARTITWPKSGMKMSLIGFGHVFQDSVEIQFTPDLTLKVVPPSILTLLKVVAYLDDPHRRKKDLADICGMLRLYEFNGDRLFSDQVINANLSDVALANAHLLGIDLGRTCNKEESRLIELFLERVTNPNNLEYADLFQIGRWSGTGLEETPVVYINAFASAFRSQVNR
jgi:predicted nucleotidyltransferase